LAQIRWGEIPDGDPGCDTSPPDTPCVPGSARTHLSAALDHVHEPILADGLPCGSSHGPCAVSCDHPPRLSGLVSLTPLTSQGAGHPCHAVLQGAAPPVALSHPPTTRARSYRDAALSLSLPSPHHKRRSAMAGLRTTSTHVLAASGVLRLTIKCATAATPSSAESASVPAIVLKVGVVPPPSLFVLPSLLSA
jgi:hypothetical protein